MMNTNIKKYVLIAAGILVAVAAILVGGAFYLLDYSLNPSGQARRDADSYRFLDSNYPGTTQWLDSMEAGGMLRDTFIIGDDGLRQHAYLARHDEAEGTAILVHGYTDNALRMMMLGKMYHDSLHFNILVPDNVRHGKSEGKVIQMGWLDRLNVERWISIADSLWNGNSIFLHGISMGAASVMMCAGDSLPPSVKGIIDDCGYTSVWDEFAGEIKNQFGLPVHPLMDIASWLCDVRYGWNFKEASAIDQVRKAEIPILFIHGDSDTFVPTDMVHQLYEAKTHGKKRLWLTKGTIHAQSYHDYPEQYLMEVKLFIEECQLSRH